MMKLVRKGSLPFLMGFAAGPTPPPPVPTPMPEGRASGWPLLSRIIAKPIKEKWRKESYERWMRENGIWRQDEEDANDIEVLLSAE